MGGRRINTRKTGTLSQKQNRKSNVGRKNPHRNTREQIVELTKNEGSTEA